MTEIKITIEINNKEHSETTMQIETETFNKIQEICKERKTSIGALILNDITEMTAEEAKEIICSWDM